MNKKWISLGLAAALYLSLLSGCSHQTNVESGVLSQDYPVTAAGVTIGAQPKGVAVLSPSLADVVLALRYEISLKARSASCTQKELLTLPEVTLDDAKGMKAAGVDLVLLDAAPSEQQEAALKAEGITVLPLAPAVNREDLTRLYTQLGSALMGGKTGYAKGEKTAIGIFLTIDDISRVIPVTDTIFTVCYLLDANGGIVTGDTMPGKLIEYAGLTNAASDGMNNLIPIEQIRISDPRFIFCPSGLKAQLTSSPQFQDLTAVKEGRVYEMPPTQMLYQGRGMIEAVSFMAGTVFPELLQGTEASGTPAASSESPASDPPASEPPASAPPASAPPESTAASTPPASQPPATPGLKFGDKSDDVKKMQERLQELKYQFTLATGLFAEGTQQSVKDFQTANGLPVTGIADAETLALIFSDKAKANPNPPKT